MEALFHRLADITYRRYKLILIVAALLTVVGSHYVIKLVKKIETDIAALIPDNYRSVRTLREIEEVVGGVGSWRLLVQSEDYEQSKRFVDDLAGSAAMIGAAGNQLIGESLYLGKPLFVMPERRHHIDLKAGWPGTA